MGPVKAVRGLDSGFNDDVNDRMVSSIYRQAEVIASSCVKMAGSSIDLDRKIDDILTSKIYGYPIMLLLLSLIFWITLVGAKYPAEALYTLFFWGEERLTELCLFLGIEDWLYGLLILGVYRGLAWVVAVMLPPMAIFFPLFTLLEDLGYLPRVAFNLDSIFKRAGAHGKQSLTMSMGFGCNAAGVIACRIIDSPRERLIAILTNNFVPCNGRFPTLIALSSIFIGGALAASFGSMAAVLSVVGMVLIGISVTLGVSWLLSKTLLKGVPSSFTLELPPYRKPQIAKVIVRSIFDRTIFVLMRAVKVAAPAGAVVWLLANVHTGGVSLLTHSANFLEPFARLMGLDGMILMAFILGMPANEIVLPIMIMGYMAEGAMLELDSLMALKGLLLDNGWTLMTALSVMLFSLLHYPCGTTLLTIKKETQSWKWTILAAVIPLLAGIVVLIVLNQGILVVQSILF
ncbi:MAG: nucleoside recognition domain-containing protein [Bacillota bacterium]